MKWLKFPLGFIGVVLLGTTIFFCGMVVYIFLRFILEDSNPIEWRDYTSPLPAETIYDLCDKFQLDTEDWLCNPQNNVYAFDFYPVFKKTFKPYNGNWLSHNEINEYIGKYANDCYPLHKLSDGRELYNCDYDIRGDGVFYIGITFHKDGSLESLRLPTELW